MKPVLPSLSKRSLPIARTGLAIAILLTLIYCLFPFYYAVLTAFKSGTAIFEPDLLPRDLDPANYINLLKQGHFGRNLLNSIGVAAATVAVSLGIGLPAAFALARIPFRGRRLLLLTVLSVSMFPQIAVLAGLFELVRALGLYNSLASLVFSYLIFTLPFTVWVLTAFIRELPIEIEEAAIIDGASTFRIITRILLPIMSPALVTIGLLAFIQAWNEFLFALTFVSSNETRTAPVAIALISGASAHETPWGAIMAASVLVTAPLIALALVFQRRIVSGLTAGSIKD